MNSKGAGLTEGMKRALVAIAGGINKYGGEGFYRSSVTGEKQDECNLSALRKRGLIAWVSAKYVFGSFLELLLTDAGERRFRELKTNEPVKWCDRG